MKRPQFSLLLLLLVVALLATIFTWRRAVSELNRLNAVPQQMNLETDLQLMEHAKATMDEQGLQVWGAFLNDQIAIDRKKLDELKNK